MAQVVFDPVQFKILYPEFAAVDDARLTALFGTAQLYLSNEDCSVVQSIPKRTQLFYLIVAHLADLRGLGANGDGQTKLVGRVASATEGTVSVSLASRVSSSATEDWWLQTQYGDEYWTATAFLRTMHYIPDPYRCVT